MDLLKKFIFTIIKMKKLGLLIGVILLTSCIGEKEEDIKVTLNYNHEKSKQKEYPEANYRTGARPVLAAKHKIDVRSFQEQYIYDSTLLDNEMKGTVSVPIEVELEVRYENYSFDVPKIYYESGLSDPFIVGFNSPPTRTVTIPVSVNPDHPSQVVEEEIVDNVTIDNETTIETFIYSWSDNFTYNQVATQEQQNTYKAFWDNASNYEWDNISIGIPNNLTTCTNSTLINDFLKNKDNASFEVYGLFCNGMYWSIGKCGWGLEISAHDKITRDCACKKSTDNSYTIRPLIGNKNWGGVGKSCSAQSQTLKVVLTR